jgi:hypothetical protein
MVRIDVSEARRGVVLDIEGVLCIGPSEISTLK